MLSKFGHVDVERVRQLEEDELVGTIRHTY